MAKIKLANRRKVCEGDLCHHHHREEQCKGASHHNTRFNNTIVMGSFAIGVALLLPTYLVCYFGVVRYRSTLREKVKNSKFMKAVTASTFYKYYASFKDITGD